jgi:hypothetical protein
MLPPGVAASSASTSTAPALEASRLVLLSKRSLSYFSDQGSNDDEMSDTTQSTRSSDADEADQMTGIHLKAGIQADADSDSADSVDADSDCADSEQTPDSADTADTDSNPEDKKSYSLLTATLAAGALLSLSPTSTKHPYGMSLVPGSVFELFAKTL